MNMWLALSAALTGYLFGSISFARIIGRFVAPGEDLSASEIEIPKSDTKFVMSSVSSTSISMRKGPRWGCLTGTLDMAKAAVPLLIFRQLFPEQPYELIAAAMAVFGHNWPLYHGFKGGRGLSPVLGGMFFIDWLGVLVTNLAGMAIGLGVFRDVLLAYAGGLILLIPWLWFRTQDGWHLAYAVFINLSFWIAMRPELKQYVHLKKDGPKITLRESLSTSDMGKSFERFERYFNFFKKDQPGGKE